MAFAKKMMGFPSDLMSFPTKLQSKRTEKIRVTFFTGKDTNKEYRMESMVYDVNVLRNMMIMTTMPMTTNSIKVAINFML